MRRTGYVALFLLLTGGLAHAEQSMVVKVRGLDLHTRAGAAVAAQRLSDAAVLFCTPRRTDGVRELDVTTLKCRRDMAARAAAKLRRPELVAVQTSFPGHQLADASRLPAWLGPPQTDSSRVKNAR